MTRGLFCCIHTAALIEFLESNLAQHGERRMLIRYLTAAVVCLVLSTTVASAQIRIANDTGGRIGTYIDKYQGLRSSGENVMIDGLCASACTIVLGAVSPEKICVTSRASLGFHAAWDFGPNGRVVTNTDATRMLYSMYPRSVQHWITARGGLNSRMIFLHGKQLAALYRQCASNTYASAMPR